jgi:hypothetical protein
VSMKVIRVFRRIEEEGEAASTLQSRNPLQRC